MKRKTDIINRTIVSLTLISITSLFSCSENISYEVDHVTYYDLGQRNNYHPLKSLGKQRVLVLPISIKDYEDNATDTNLKRIKNVFTGKNDFINVHDFYYKSSYKKLDIEFVVPDQWFECNMNPYEIQEDMDSSYGVIPLIDKGLDWYFGEYQNKYNRKDFDLDSDGFIDGIFAVYDSPNYTNTTDYTKKYKVDYPENFWALSASSLKHLKGDVDNPVSKAYCWASYDFMDEYGIEGTTDSHTFIHEMGHMLGLNDYYANRTSKYVTSCPIGVIDMMDNNIGDHDPFSKYSLGWTEPTVITESTTVELESFTEKGDFVLIGPKDYNKTPFDEYFTIELVTPTGLNKKDYVNGYTDIPGYSKPGIRVLHVDSRARDAINGNYTDDESKMVKVTSSNTSSVFHSETGKSEYQITLIQNGFDEDGRASVIDDNKQYLRNLISGSQDPDDSLFQTGDTLDMREGSKYLELMPSLTNTFNSYEETGKDEDVFAFTMDVVSINSKKATIKIDFGYQPS